MLLHLLREAEFDAGPKWREIARQGVDAKRLVVAGDCLTLVDMVVDLHGNGHHRRTSTGGDV